MKILRRWLGDPDGLERAKQIDEQAAKRLAEAEEQLGQAEQRVEQVRAGWSSTIRNALWAERTLDENHLTRRFITELRHGGHT